MPRRLLPSLILIVLWIGQSAQAQNAALVPKFGRSSNDTELSAPEQQFLAESDRKYQGNRKKASAEWATSAWQLLRQGRYDDAMQRFNQAWLLDSSNGHSLWGMGQIMANRGQGQASLKLFAEANRLIGFDLDFSVDYARALSLAGVRLGDKKLLDQAFGRFAQIHTRAPQHTLNLQNWAIALFYTGQYAQAWDKVKLAEATPRRAELDKRFLSDLQARLARP